MHNTLSNYYSTIRIMVESYHYTINDIENLFPFERDIFIEMIIDDINKEKERNESKWQAQ